MANGKWQNSNGLKFGICQMENRLSFEPFLVLSFAFERLTPLTGCEITPHPSRSGW
jgi:hypothetical protein